MKCGELVLAAARSKTGTQDAAGLGKRYPRRHTVDHCIQARVVQAMSQSAWQTGMQRPCHRVYRLQGILINLIS